MKGLKELLKEARENTELTEDQFEEKLNKLLPEEWIPKNKFNELNDTHKMTKSQLDQASKQLDELKKSTTLTDEQKQQLDTLKTQMDEQTKNHEKEVAELRKNFAIDKALTNAKAKNAKAVRALIDEDKLVLAEDGTLSGLGEQLEAVQKDNDYLFDTTDQNQEPEAKKPTFGNQPTGGGGGDELLASMMGAAGIKE